jgi:Protein of unknown function (DUF3096)
MGKQHSRFEIGERVTERCRKYQKAGILILIIPRLLNYVVAVYLILVGVIGLIGV